MDKFLAIYMGVLKKYVDFEGRARRQEYWTFFLVNLVIAIVLGIIGGIIGTGILSNLYALAILLPSIAVGVRRLHDRDMSGWFMLLALIPFVGGIILLVLFALEGTPGSNRFGPDPKAGEPITDQPPPV